MIVYFDTVRRNRPVVDAGELVQLDWSTKKILKKFSIYPTDPDISHDPNPRGNSRGGKGIIIDEKEIFVGTYHTIMVLDFHLNLVRKFSNSLFSNIHEMCFSGTHIWVSCCAIDCAVKVTRQGETVKTWWPREESILQRRYDLRPMNIDKTIDNRLKFLHLEVEKTESHTHLNSVVSFGDNTYALLNRQGAIVQLEPKVDIILEDKLMRGAHSPVIKEDGNHIILCSSFRKEILIYSLNDKALKKRIRLTDFDEISILNRKYPDQPFNKSIFVRGLEIIDSERILVGISPASILEIDIARQKLLDFYQYSSDVCDAVHGLVHLDELKDAAVPK